MRRGQARGQQPEPIARWERVVDRGGLAGDAERLLMDTLAMTIHLHVGPRTVRRYPPVACDLRTKAPLWDALAVGAARQQVRPRTARLRPA